MAMPDRIEIRSWLRNLTRNQILAKENKYSAFEWQDIKVLLNAERIPNTPSLQPGEHAVKADREAAKAVEERRAAEELSEIKRLKKYQ